MRFEVETIDDALLRLYPELLSCDQFVTASRGRNAELLGVLIEIENPRARLSRSETRGKFYSSLGEFLWYLTRDNRLDFIEPYISRYRDESEDHGVTVYGGYGPRLFRQRGCDQVKNIISLLQKRPTSRKAVIQLFNAEDINSKHNEIPCTTALQFAVRGDRVHLMTTMRSNDAYLGLPHDVFCFTMLQEIVARSLNRDVGKYRHFVGSMHLYDVDRERAQDLVDEGFQSRVDMPPMPYGDPWPAVDVVLAAEARIRTGEPFEADHLGLDPYWADLVRILQVFFSSDERRIEALRDDMNFSRYRPYISARLGKAHDEK